MGSINNLVKALSQLFLFFWYMVKTASYILIFLLLTTRKSERLLKKNYITTLKVFSYEFLQNKIRVTASRLD